VYIVQALQARVALDRIADFLAEDEVPNYVSSLKRAPIASASNFEDEKIGIENSTFKWNQPKQTPSEGTTKQTMHTAQISDATMVDEDDQEAGKAVFELSDINVIFPTGHMTVVTGDRVFGNIDPLPSLTLCTQGLPLLANLRY
jgi:hypothetical protein